MRWEALLAAGGWNALALLVCVGAGAPVVCAEEPEASAETSEVPELVGDETSRAIAELVQRVADLERRGQLDPGVQGPLNGVKLALEAMRQARAAGDRAAGARADALARAGLALAERRYALSVEQALLRAAKARRDAARVHADHSAAARAAEQRRLDQLVSAPQATGKAP
jgi:hypothetical protein